MVPKKAFIEKWNNNTNDDIHVMIKELAGIFRCSGSVIARRALDNKKIDKNIDQCGGISHCCKRITSTKLAHNNQIHRIKQKL